MILFAPRTLSKIAAAFALAACAASLHAGAEIPQAIYQKTQQDIVPAICKISYSVEITNTNTGDVSRRPAYTQGIIVSPDGLVMVHGHMEVENRKPLNPKISVGTGDDRKEYDATVLKKPDDINVLFLRINTEEETTFPYATFARDGKLSLGESFLTVGLLGESLDYTKAMQSHRIGAILEEPRLTYCLDTPISFGYVGGPVINAAGELIGVLGFDLSAGEGGDLYTRSGHPLAYQASLFQKYIDTPPTEDDEKTEDAWLGVFTQPLTDDLGEYWDLPLDGGVVVSTVIAGSPADRAGLRMGDVITSFNDQPVVAKQDQDVVSFTKLVRESPLDSPLPVRFYRDGQPTEIRLTLTKRPKAGRDANEFEDTVFGMTVREMTTDLRIALNLADNVQGVIIRRIKSGSPANLARLRPNFIVMSLGGYAVDGIDSYKKVLDRLSKERPEEVAVFCRIGANTAFFRIKPRWE